MHTFELIILKNLSRLFPIDIHIYVKDIDIKIDTYTNRYKYTCIQTKIHTYILKQINVYICIYEHKCMYTNLNTYIHTYKQTYIHVYKITNIYSYT